MIYNVYFKGFFVGKVCADNAQVRKIEASGFILKTA